MSRNIQKDPDKFESNSGIRMIGMPTNVGNRIKGHVLVPFSLYQNYTLPVSVSTMILGHVSSSQPLAHTQSHFHYEIWEMISLFLNPNFKFISNFYLDFFGRSRFYVYLKILIN